MRARYEWVAPYPPTRETGMKQNYIVLRTCFIYSMAMRMPCRKALTGQKLPFGPAPESGHSYPFPDPENSSPSPF